MSKNISRKVTGSNTGNAGHFATTERRRTAIVLDEGDTHDFVSETGMTGTIEVHNEDSEYQAETTRPVPVYECVADHLRISPEQAEKLVDTHRPEIQELLAEPYETTFDDEDEDGRWGFRFACSGHGDVEDARVAMEHNPNVARSYNKEDHGSFGSENLGRVVADELERRGAVLPKPPHTVRA